MTSNVKDMRCETRSRLRDGNGDAQLTHLFAADKLSGKMKMCARVLLEHGCSIGEHSHDTDGELYIVLRGKGMVNDNGTPREVTAGDAVWTTGGEFHSIINHGEEPLELYAIVIN